MTALLVPLLFYLLKRRDERKKRHFEVRYAEYRKYLQVLEEIVEGVIVEENAVISMGVFIGASTKIYDRASGQILYGRVPSGAVVVPGTLPSADGKYGLYCAVIVKKVDAQTRAKTAINELLRGE